MQRVRRAIVFPYSAGPPGSGQILPGFLWRPPEFGGRCACCNEPGGSGELFLFAEREEHKTSLAVPVCPACEHHASSSRPGQAFAVVAIFVALAVCALTWFDPSVLPFAANPL